MSSTSITIEQVETTIVEALATFNPDVEGIERDATFEALDIDSLDLVELSQIIEDEFGVILASADVAGLKTVGDVIDLVASRAA